MTYSFQLYTVRGPLEEDLEGTVKRVAELGFTAVEPYNFVATADALAAALTANGLTAPSGHAPLLRDDQDEIFQAAQKLGIGTVIDPHVDSARWTTEADIKETAKALNEAAAKGAGYGVAVGYHNHEFELENRIDGRSALEVLAENLGSSGSCSRWTRTGLPSAEKSRSRCWTERLGDGWRFIHIKDGPLTKVDKDQVAVGAGKMPIGRIFGCRQEPRSRRRGAGRFQRGHFRRRQRFGLAYLKAGSNGNGKLSADRSRRRRHHWRRSSQQGIPGQPHKLPGCGGPRRGRHVREDSRRIARRRIRHTRLPAASRLP